MDKIRVRVLPRELKVQCLPREPPLVSRLGVTRDFGQRLVAGDRLDLVGTQTPCRSAYRESLVCRFKCTVACTASTRSPPAAMA